MRGRTESWTYPEVVLALCLQLWPLVGRSFEVVTSELLVAVEVAVSEQSTPPTGCPTAATQ